MLGACCRCAPGQGRLLGGSCCRFLPGRCFLWGGADAAGDGQRPGVLVAGLSCGRRGAGSGRRTRRQRCQASRAARRPSTRSPAGRGPPAAGSAARARSRAAARHPSWSSRRGVLPGTEATATANTAVSSQDLMSAADHGLVARQAMATSGPITYLVRQISFPSVAVPRERLPKVRDTGPAYRHRARASMPDSCIGPVAVHGDHRSAAALSDAAGYLTAASLPLRPPVR